MNIYFTFLALCLSMLSTSILAQKSAILAKYQWKNRIVLVFSPSEKNKIYQMQQLTLAKDMEGIKERDIIVFDIFEKFGKTLDKQTLSHEDCLYLRERFRIGEEEFCIVLIGKDGGEKYRKNTIFSSEELFAVIDAMPMRRAEKNSRKH